MAYRAILMAAELLHAAGAGVILDAPYGHREDRDALRWLDPLWVECRVSPDLAARRFRERGFDAERPDLTEAIVRESARQYRYTDGALALDTDRMTAEECVQVVLASIRRNGL